MTAESRLVALETHLAHQARLVEDLNDVVTRQSAEIAALTRRLAALSAALTEALAEAPAQQKPPHY
jgi:SlyX protein